MQIRPLRRSPQASTLARVAALPYRRLLISDLVKDLKSYLDPAAVDEIYRAYLFGAEAHEGQHRRSGEPYIYHPLEVARILAEMRMDSRSIIAAILHDVIEDTPNSKDEIAREFGEDVAHIVDGVSKIGQIEFESREQAEAENFRKMLMAMARDIRVIIIKLADRLHNMRTLKALPAEKRRVIARQTLDIYAPIANRLGMHQWSRQLEDLGFEYLYPGRHEIIAKSLKRRQGNRKAIIKKLRVAVETHLAQEGIQAKIMGREKNVYSIYKKMQGKRMSFNDIHDIFAFRIVVDSVDTCYRALGVVHNLYKPIPGRFKDYIAIPKANGYQSLHTLVFGPFGGSLEIQIRSEEMHRIAESGVAAHWLYKSPGGKNEPHELARQWMLDLLDTQQQSGNPGEFLEHLKIDLFPDEVYLFTPKGDIKKLPRGATALDFAYAVHSDVGDHCVGARVNHRLVSLNHELGNGDHAEVLTSKSAHPTPVWLSYTVTSKARVSIRAYLKKQKRKDSVRLGKKLLDRSLKAMGHGRRKKIRPGQKERLLAALKLETWNDLLADVGLGKRLPMIVAQQLLPSEEDAEFDPNNVLPLAIHGTEGMLISYAKCCRPIPGDPLHGLLTAGRGIVIHTADCPNTAEFRKHPDKWIHIEWAPDVSGEFQVAVRVDAENKRGVLASLAATIAELDSNIDSVSVVERDGLCSTINFVIEVRDRVHLAQIMRHLRGQNMATRIARIKG